MGEGSDRPIAGLKMTGDAVGGWLEDRGRRKITQLLSLAWDPIGVSDEEGRR